MIMCLLIYEGNIHIIFKSLKCAPMARLWYGDSLFTFFLCQTPLILIKIFLIKKSILKTFKLSQILFSKNL